MESAKERLERVRRGIQKLNGRSVPWRRLTLAVAVAAAVLAVRGAHLPADQIWRAALNAGLGLVALSIVLALTWSVSNDDRENERRRARMSSFDWELRKQNKLAELLRLEQLAIDACEIEQAAAQSAPIKKAAAAAAQSIKNEKPMAEGVASGAAATMAAAEAPVGAGRPRRL
jgi:hypothetical protein